jgi:hypothetical protein
VSNLPNEHESGRVGAKRDGETCGKFEISLYLFRVSAFTRAHRYRYRTLAKVRTLNSPERPTSQFSRYGLPCQNAAEEPRLLRTRFPYQVGLTDKVTGASVVGQLVAPFRPSAFGLRPAFFEKTDRLNTRHFPYVASLSRTDRQLIACELL